MLKMLNILARVNRHGWSIRWIHLIVMCNLYKELRCTKELRLLGMLSETGISYKSAGSCLTAIDMALEDIGNHGNILKDYYLNYTWVDSKCHAGTALFRMFERIQYDPPYQMLLGPACSVAGEATAQVSYMWNLTQLSCETSSPILSDRTRFRWFFRLIMPDQKINIARIALLEHFNWMKVATVHQAREFFSAITDDFVHRIKGTNISIITQEIFANNPLSKVNNLKRHDARIILTAMYEDKARQLICAAYKVGFYGPKIVWMFIGWYSPTFWQNDLENIDCTKEQMALVVEGAFMTGGLYKNPIDERGIANLTVSEFERRYFNHPKYNPKWKNTDGNSAALCYDHIWAAALALNCTAQVLKEIGHNKTLEQFTYADGDIGRFIFECMGNISMIGVSGKTTFNEGSDSDKVTLIERIQDSRRVEVALYRQDLNPSYFKWFEGALIWKGNLIPSDSAQIMNKEIKLPVSLYVVMVTLGSIGVCLSLCFLGINVLYRNNRYIKLSSPNINNMLLLGCVLCYLTVFFKTMGMEHVAICRARVYCFSLGFTLTFGSLFSKTWRVYRIFLNKKLNKVQIKDSQLLVVNGLLVALILVQCIIWDIVGPPKMNSKFLTKEVYISSDGTEIRPFVRVCWSKYSEYFTWALYITQGGLLTFGTFLAWETRHVRVKVLNDSQKIGICLYNVVILTAVGLLLSLLLDDQEVLLYGISSGFLIFGTTVTQMLIFIPKVRAIVNKVEVEPISTLAVNTGKISARASNSVDSTQVPDQVSLKIQNLKHLSQSTT